MYFFKWWKFEFILLFAWGKEIIKLILHKISFLRPNNIEGVVVPYVQYALNIRKRISGYGLYVT